MLTELEQLWNNYIHIMDSYIDSIQEIHSVVSIDDEKGRTAFSDLIYLICTKKKLAVQARRAISAKLEDAFQK
jgi:hypothetical protein